jgi:hypothetical protein
MKSRLKFTFFIFLISIILLGSEPINCYAETYYVDQNHPSASDSNPGTEALPWLHARFGARRLVAGDTLIIKAGFYHHNTGNRHEPGVNPANSGTAQNPIIIKANPGDDVYIMGTPNINNPASSMLSPAIGAYNYNRISHIIIDGFKIYGCATLWKADYCTIQNCEIWAGGVYEGTDDFGSLIRVEATNHCRIFNNLLRDGEDPRNRGINSPMLQEYTSSNLVIENNEFRNGVSYAIRLKDGANNVIVRNNLIRNMNGYAISGGNQNRGSEIDIYQNVILNCGGAIFWRSFLTGVRVYNNTIYNSPAGYGVIQLYSPQNVQFFNNIFYVNSGTYLRCVRNGGLSGTDVTYLDYNNYYGNASWVGASDLSGWQAYCDNHGSGGTHEGDDHSVTSNPGFLNAGGQNAESYKRTSYPTNGRGGSYPNVMGAYLNDNSIIGLTNGRADVSQVAQVEPPSSPSRLRIIAQ